MTTSYKKKALRLYETADAQGGYFTTQQAAAAGYAASTHSYNIKAGNWVREHRGIYRLANYPYPDRPDLITWSLWSCNRKGEPQGVYSHETALSVYDLSDLNPAKIHMSVPKTFRRNSAIPRGLVLHKGTFTQDEAQSMYGFKVSRPLRAIADLLFEQSVEMGFLRQAVQQAFQRGLLTNRELEQSHLSETMKERIMLLQKSP